MDLYGLLDAIIKKVNHSVKIEAQELDEGFQRQARDNIKAAHKDDICNYNLLDNWFFLNPVNQKNQVEYSTGVTIDRWYADGITTINSGISSTSAYYQMVNDNFIRSLLGKTITLSALDNNSLTYATFKLPDTLPLEYVFVDKIAGDNNFSIVLKAGNYSQLFRLNNGCNNLIAAKAEIGENQTLARKNLEGVWVINEIPNYQEELLKCRQYDNYTGAYIGLANFCQPNNLLDNSDFTNPVNQKEVTNLISTSGNFIDRWKIESNSGEAVVNDGYISLRADTGQVWLSQYLQKYIPIGTKVTLAMKLIEGNLLLVSTIITATGNGYVIPGGNFWIDGNEQGCGRICIVPSAGTTWNIAWVALYEGEYTTETLPNYQSKGYATEMSVCAQYSINTGAYIGHNSFILLWENASPTSDFVAQTLELDLSEYEFVVIEALYSPTYSAKFSTWHRVGTESSLFIPYTNSSIYLAMREITVNANGITFAAGQRQSLNAASQTESSNNAIPLVIYGVRRV